MKKLKAKSYQFYAGFTLIELLIYLAITAGIVTSFASFAINTSGGSEKALIVTQVNSEARFALDFITAKVREASAISAVPTILTLTMPALPDLEFFLDGDRLQVEEKPGVITALTSDNLAVTNLVFTNLAPVGERSNVRISFTLGTRPSADGPPVLAYAASFRTAVSRRK